jgi:hypothetical protein
MANDFDKFFMDFGTTPEEKEKLKDAASALFDIFTSLKEAGFTDEQAMQMMKILSKGE